LKLTAVITLSMYARNQLVANDVISNEIIKALTATTGTISGATSGVRSAGA
jgi:uncharacterized protein with FMN-binding domain